MICPKCGAVVPPKKNHCDKCGHDLSVKVKAHKLAHYYYNKGLQRAKIHDISGAILMLTRSVELEKDFVAARNLLGLCYFEIGEVAVALKEWIISKNLKENNPLADKYLGIIQNNQTKLKNYRKAIEKYNNGLKLCKDKGFDLALIQLKKAVTLNPDYVKAWQLLAIVYMYQEDYDKARKCLKRSLKTDIANPTSLRYMKEIRDERYKKITGGVSLSEITGDDRDAKIILDGKPTENIKPHYNYKETGPDYKVFLSLMAGILVGIMIVYFLVVPGIKQSLKQEYLTDQKNNGEQMSQYLTRMDSLEKENASLLKKLEYSELEAEGLNDKLNKLSDEKKYANVVKMAKYYIELSSRAEKPSDIEMYHLKNKMLAVTESELKVSEAKFIYNAILKKYPKILETKVSGDRLFEKGKEYFEAEKYTNARIMFDYCFKESPDNDENLYYLAKTYQLLKDKKNALKYYKEYTEKFPDGKYSEDAEKYVNANE